MVFALPTCGIPARLIFSRLATFLVNFLRKIVQLGEGADVGTCRCGRCLAGQLSFDEHVAHGDDDDTGS